MEEKLKRLAEPFRDDEIEWRISAHTKGSAYAYAVPYVDNRAIQNRLDEVVGPFNWRNEFVQWHTSGGKFSQLCGISIYNENRQEWITKYDGAENSDIEPVKGGLSDAMKRSAVQWQIGRYLYQANSVKVSVELSKSGKPYIMPQERSRLDREHQRIVKEYLSKNSGADRALPQTGQEIYTVIDISCNNGVSALKLAKPGGEPFIAYFNGQMNDIRKGSKLKDADIRRKQKDGRQYNMINSYKTAA